MEVLSRTVRLARFNGMSVLAISGTLALFCAMGHSVVGAVAGLLVALGAAAEIHGAGRISQGNSTGITWLVLSQLFLLFVILGYCYYRLTHLSEEMQLLLQVLTQEQIDTIRENYHMTPKEFFEKGFKVGYYAVALGTLVYQGGLMLVYGRRRRSIEDALHQE